tara:strand:- start:9376 stop:12150 length:2775 start_codon:yes stop_codon:yes gene_type:complete
MKFDILHNFISPITGRVLAERDYVLVGDRQGIATPSPALMDMRLDILNLNKAITDSNLTHESTFILQQPSQSLPNAQSLSDTGIGMMKTIEDGVIDIASAGNIPDLNDYVDPASLIGSIEVQALETTAEITGAIAAEALITSDLVLTTATTTLATAAIASTAHFELAMLPYSFGIIGTGLQIHSDISAKKDEAITIAAQYAREQDALQTVDLSGDINVNGLISGNLTTTFTQNPKFYGSEAVQIPFGSTADRPIIASLGMFRYNTDSGLEYYDATDWRHVVASAAPVALTLPYATDLVYGVLGNTNGIFDGFASLERDLDIKIKTSYFTGELGDSSSASLSLLDRYNNGYINKTISSNTSFFDYLLQKQDNGTKTDLLKFDNKIDEFVFHKPISYNGKNIIKYDEAVDIVTGVLNNSNGLFSGFTTDSQEIDIKIKTAHFAADDYSSSSLSFLNRYNNGYIFSNKTNSDWSDDFSFSGINNEIKTELFKYDGLSNKFVFNKSVEVPYPINNEDATNKYYVDNAASGVKDVLGTTGEIVSSGGDYPQISLANTGVSSGNYTLANINVDTKGRVVNIGNGQAVTSIIAGFGLNGGTITNTGTLSLSNSGVSYGTYARANISVDSAGRITSASNGSAVTSITAGSGLTGGTITDTGTISLTNTGITAGSYNVPNLTLDLTGRVTSIGESNNIQDVTFHDNVISTTNYDQNLVINPNHSGGNGGVNIKADTSLENGSYLRLYDSTNSKYTEITPPNLYTQSSTWILPTTTGFKDQFIKMGDNDQLEWTTIITDPGVSQVDTGYGLTGGPITNIGTVSLSDSGVVPGSYNAASITVDSAGRVTHTEESYRMKDIYFFANTLYTLGDPYFGTSDPIVMRTPLINDFGVYLTYGGYDAGSVARKNGGGYLYVNSQEQLIFINSTTSYVLAG